MKLDGRRMREEEVTLREKKIARVTTTTTKHYKGGRGKGYRMRGGGRRLPRGSLRDKHRE